MGRKIEGFTLMLTTKSALNNYSFSYVEMLSEAVERNLRGA